MNIDNFYLVCLVYTEKQAIRIKCLQGLACSPPISVRPPCITEGIIFCLPNIQQLTTVHVNKQNLDPIYIWMLGFFIILPKCPGR